MAAVLFRPHKDELPLCNLTLCSAFHSALKIKKSCFYLETTMQIKEYLGVVNSVLQLQEIVYVPTICRNDVEGATRREYLE